MTKTFARICAGLMIIIFHIDLLFSLVTGPIIILLKRTPALLALLIRRTVCSIALGLLNSLLVFLKVTGLWGKNLQKG